MPRYYFDFHDGRSDADETGTECPDFAAARAAAMSALPEVARDAIPEGSDDQVFTVLVRDENGAGVYEATLTYTGRKLDGAETP